MVTNIAMVSPTATSTAPSTDTAAGTIDHLKRKSNALTTIKDFANGKKPLTSGAVYLWHCNRDGRYSL